MLEVKKHGEEYPGGEVIPDSDLAKGNDENSHQEPVVPTSRNSEGNRIEEKEEMCHWAYWKWIWSTRRSPKVQINLRLHKVKRIATRRHSTWENVENSGL